LKRQFGTLKMSQNRLKMKNEVLNI
jgi:hypothetical protein